MDNREGIIYKALSGFYYVEADGETVECRARGRFRMDKTIPLVGDKVIFNDSTAGKGYLIDIMPRRNAFIRPAVANIDVMVVIASAVIPISDPFLIDRVTSIASANNCETVICINKCDLDSGDELYNIYDKAGFKVIRTSAVRGDGIKELSAAIAGKTCAFTGNTGVGKSSLLNAMQPGLVIKTGDVSSKLGRGRHTTRHVELFKMDNGATIADTPGFSSFDIEQMEFVKKDTLQYSFKEFIPYIDDCKFSDCSHTKERGCAVLEAVKNGKIQVSRHRSYVRLYEQVKNIKDWESADYVKYSEK